MVAVERRNEFFIDAKFSEGHRCILFFSKADWPIKVANVTWGWVEAGYCREEERDYILQRVEKDFGMFLEEEYCCFDPYEEGSK